MEMLVLECVILNAINEDERPNDEEEEERVEKNVTFMC